MGDDYVLPQNVIILGSTLLSSELQVPGSYRCFILCTEMYRRQRESKLIVSFFGIQTKPHPKDKWYRRPGPMPDYESAINSGYLLVLTSSFGSVEGKTFCHPFFSKQSSLIIF